MTAPDQSALNPVLADYDQAIARPPDPGDRSDVLNHILRVFLIDRAGLVRNIYSLDFLDPNLVLTDIRTLLSEEDTQD